MGRPIVPDHLKRRPITISMPLDVVMFLDNYKSKTGNSRSRLIESFIRQRMTTHQTSIEDRWAFNCEKCKAEYNANSPKAEKCPRCNTFETYLIGKIQGDSNE